MTAAGRGRPRIPVAPDGDRLVYDLDGIRAQYAELRAELPDAVVRFAMKAAPSDEILRTLGAAGAGVDAAGPQELRQALRAGISVEATHYGNTVKSDTDIADAYALGVRTFATDSVQDVRALARHAPGARVFCRLAVDGEGALWGLKHKFGCSAADTVHILRTARRLGLVPSGLSVHVGSQQMDADAWHRAFERLSAVMITLEEHGIVLDHVNLGGGLPARGYLDSGGVPLDPPLDKIFATLREGIEGLRAVHGEHLRLVMEPGRSLVADHGTIHARVVRLTRRQMPDGSSQHWLYLSCGKFNGLYEMDAIQYRLRFPAGPAGPLVPAVVAGPTCDSDDAYPHDRGLVRVPEGLASGDPVEVLACGAYALSYTTRGFNGFMPLPVVFTGGPPDRGEPGKAP
ncbi:MULTISPECIES: type III PLP-dependent enzyme [unclassified Streptomyces]|uniref:type III PLP-dependent enzyme n=1 Tax=unclassified Streptomyces TaxID=2593676 RepID=UPI000DAE0D28|nr:MULTISPECIES: type III PLP-dependent enzyme [unclassified Streptomyces]PZT71776.1 type III PLP-dependent enzyme [Streptomyces sp. AC1-42T]PZT73099.1 type III PLP-dependent enzyme [Streptomyces sp. AC1-42W]